MFLGFTSLFRREPQFFLVGVMNLKSLEVEKYESLHFTTITFDLQKKAFSFCCHVYDFVDSEYSLRDFESLEKVTIEASYQSDETSNHAGTFEVNRSENGLFTFVIPKNLRTLHVKKITLLVSPA